MKESRHGSGIIDLSSQSLLSSHFSLCSGFLFSLLFHKFESPSVLSLFCQRIKLQEPRPLFPVLCPVFPSRLSCSIMHWIYEWNLSSRSGTWLPFAALHVESFLQREIDRECRTDYAWVDSERRKEKETDDDGGGKRFVSLRGLLWQWMQRQKEDVMPSWHETRRTRREMQQMVMSVSFTSPSITLVMLLFSRGFPCFVYRHVQERRWWWWWEWEACRVSSLNSFRFKSPEETSKEEGQTIFGRKPTGKRQKDIRSDRTKKVKLQKEHQSKTHYSCFSFCKIDL